MYLLMIAMLKQMKQHFLDILISVILKISEHYFHKIIVLHLQVLIL